jgi:hypothetical protein
MHLHPIRQGCGKHLTCDLPVHRNVKGFPLCEPEPTNTAVFRRGATKTTKLENSANELYRKTSRPSLDGGDSDDTQLRTQVRD